jgi:hypothetical protein
MQEKITLNSSIKKKIFKHGLVLVTFLILTMIVTFPVVLDFGTQAAGQNCYDKCHMMWRMWWAGFAVDNNLDFYHTQYLFQPSGTVVSGNLAQFTTGIGAVLQNVLGSTLTWNIIWLSGFVFGGYGAFLLAEYLTKNPLASVIAGIIFTFSTYHLVHSNFHIGLSMIVWIPLFVLILFKILQKDSKLLIILGSSFFFLAAITHVYFLMFLLMFSAVFFAVFIFKQKNVSNKIFTKNFSLILGIGLIAALIMFAPTLMSDTDYEKRTLDEHIKYSGGLGKFFMPTIFHSTQIHTDHWLMTVFFDLFNEDPKHVSSEGDLYLGYPVIFLSILALKFRFKFSWFWVFVGIGSAILSLGPELKMIHNLTGIWMPERILYDYMPKWEEFRATGRFIIITHLSMAILSAYAINGIMKSKYFSKKVLILIVIVVAAIIIFDSSAIPYPTHTEPISEIYKEIKNDKSEFIILESPIGSRTTSHYTSHPSFNYYQITHEKPIVGGYESRASVDGLMQSNNYFFSKFQFYGNGEDILKQDLGIHGIPILNYFDVKYVIIHKNEPISFTDQTTRRISVEDTTTSNVISRTSDLMSEILNQKKPYYEDDNLISYKIPESSSQKPFLLLGKGWYEAWWDINLEETQRGMHPESIIKIVNPREEKTEFSMKIELMGYKQSRNIEIFFNGKYLFEENIPPTPITLELNKLQLMPGENIFSIRSDGYEVWVNENDNRQEKTSLIGLGIYEK